MSQPDYSILGLEPTTDNQTSNYDTKCSDHHPSLSTLRSKGLSLSKMKWWAVYTSLPVHAIVRLFPPWNGDSEGQETSFASSANDKPTTMTQSAQTTIPRYQH